jgi:hypothetical protein
MEKAAPVIALIVVLAFIGLVALWMLRPPTGDAASLSLLNALVMVVGTAFLTVINNYFSSTRESAEKNATIRALATGAPAAPNSPTVPPAA